MVPEMFEPLKDPLIAATAFAPNFGKFLNLVEQVLQNNSLE